MSNENISNEQSIFENIDPDINSDVPFSHNMCKNYSVSEFCSLNLNDENFSVLNYNIRSFHTNGSDFIGLIDSLKFNFKCIVLTETWNNMNNVQLCNIAGYDDFHVYRPPGHIYSISGGVSVFCDSRLDASFNETLSICHEDIEVCVVQLIHNNENHTIIALYRPPQGSKENFVQLLDNILCQVDLESSIVSILGDFNINIDQIENSIVSDLLSKLYSDGLISLINKPARFPNDLINSSPSTLDLIWTNKLDIGLSGILDYFHTDHLPTFCFINSKTSDETGKIRIESRPYSEDNYAKLCSELCNINWDDLLNYDDIDDSCIKFIDHLNMSYRRCFPLKVKYISQSEIYLPKAIS